MGTIKTTSRKALAGCWIDRLSANEVATLDAFDREMLLDEVRFRSTRIDTLEHENLAALTVAVATSRRRAQCAVTTGTPRPLPAPEEILTPADVAAILAIPQKTVIFLCAEGRLVGAFKAGRRWRIPGRAVRQMAGSACP